MKARGAGCSSAVSQPILTITQGKGAQGVVSRGADVLAARGLPSLLVTATLWSQQCPHHQCLPRVDMGSSCGFWLLSMSVAVLSALSLLAEGKPQAVQWFDPHAFILSASSCHPHSAHKILIENFTRHSFNSFNSFANRQLPLLSNCLTHFLSEQSSGSLCSTSSSQFLHLLIFFLSQLKQAVKNSTGLHCVFVKSILLPQRSSQTLSQNHSVFSSIITVKSWGKRKDAFY